MVHVAILRGRLLTAGTISGVPTRGTPQGGILSPLVWNLSINILLTKLRAKRLTAVGYADDLLLLTHGRNDKVIKRRTQQAIDLAVEWATWAGIKFNPAKTDYVLFTNKRQDTDYIMVAGDRVEQTYKLKYLG